MVVHVTSQARSQARIPPCMRHWRWHQRTSFRNQDPQASRRCVVASARRCHRPTYTLARAAVPLQATVAWGALQTALATRASGTRGAKASVRVAYTRHTSRGCRVACPRCQQCLSGAESDDGWQGGTDAQGRAHRSRYLPPPPTSARMPPPYVSYQLELRVDRWGPSPRRNSAQSTRGDARACLV